MGDWIESMAGPGYATAILWTLGALILLVIVLVAIKVMRSLTFGTFVAGGRNRRTRLAVIDATAVDSNRRLVLVRRDEVEHLILIGGPSDVVVEQGIHAGREPVHEERPQRPHPVAAPEVSAPPRQRPAPVAQSPERRPDPAPRPAPAPEPAQRQPAPAPARPAPAPAPEKPSMLKRFERVSASAAATIPFTSRNRDKQAEQPPAPPFPPREPVHRRVEAEATVPPQPQAVELQPSQAAVEPPPQQQPMSPAAMRADPVMEPDSAAPEIDVEIPMPRREPEIVHDLDATLLEELEVTLENPAGRQDEPGSRSRDDDMDKLLGELSGPRRT